MSFKFGGGLWPAVVVFLLTWVYGEEQIDRFNKVETVAKEYESVLSRTNRLLFK